VSRRAAGISSSRHMTLRRKANRLAWIFGSFDPNRALHPQGRRFRAVIGWRGQVDALC
jgi:hypothetical protein